MIKISVIIPVYNVEKYIKTCLDSVVGQSLHGVEIICVDDGSTDGSSMILKKYEKEKENIRVFTQCNQGAGPARNLGIKYAVGQYLCFMDPDDYYPNDTALEKLYVAAEQENAMICGGNILADNGKGIKPLQISRFEQNKKIQYEDFLEIFFYWRFIYKTELIKDNDIFFPTYRRFQDPPFLVKAMLCAKELYVIKDVVYVYRIKRRLADHSFDVVVNILQGCRDICQYAKGADLNILCDKIVEFLMDDIYVIRYAVQGEEKIWRLIDDINAISGLKEITPYRIEQYVSSCRSERNLLLDRCYLYGKVIIYGAGVVGIYILEYLMNKRIDVLGFAVTTESDNAKEIFGHKVKDIEKYIPYRGEALIIVAVGNGYQDAIWNTLDRLGFMHVILLDYKKIRLLEMIER